MRVFASLLLAVTLGGGCLCAQSFRVSSPDGLLTAAVAVSVAGVRYRVDYRGRPVLLESALDPGLPRAPIRLGGVSRGAHESSWRPVYGERAEIPDKYRELEVDVTGASGDAPGSRLTFRCYNEGLAFRYTVLGSGPVTITAERTEFRFPPAAMAYEEHGAEGPYQRVPVTRVKARCERPLTIDYGNGVFASLTEAALVDYPRMLLSPVAGKPGVLFSDLDGPATGTAPFSTPWRVLVVGDRPGDLLERNYLVLNLNPPSEIADTSWIKPGKAIREVTLSTRGGRECVDFAVARGLQYIEYDAGWYGHEYDEAQDATTVTPDPKRAGQIENWGGLDLQAVIDYARQRGIGVFLYVNRRHL